MNYCDPRVLALLAPRDDDDVMVLCAKLELLSMGSGMVRATPRRQNGAWNRLTHHLGREEPGEPCTPRSKRPRCGARTRKGTPCKAPVIWNDELDRPRNGRCRVHGGLSTGPKGKGKRPEPSPVDVEIPGLVELPPPPDVDAILEANERAVDEMLEELSKPLDLDELLAPVDLDELLNP